VGFVLLGCPLFFFLQKLSTCLYLNLSFNSPVNILICPDKFKGTLKASDVCDAIATGVSRIYPQATIDTVPLADGGEGTCDLLTEWDGGKKIQLSVHGPLASPVEAQYGISKDGKTAFIEMAEASGLTLLQPAQRNPLFTTSVGTGELIRDALDQKVKKIILGLGGSATNDAGTGMALALGYLFCDTNGQPLNPIGKNLISIRYIHRHAVDERLKKIMVVALCDVTNPLCGPDGAAYVYGPQKGADKDAVELLDAGLRNFKRMVTKHLKVSPDFPGAGAAGGLGGGAKVFLNASIEKGIDYVIRSTGLEEKIKKADLIVTGEGKIDQQTFSGKVVSEVSRLAGYRRKSVIAVCGKCELSDLQMKGYGIEKVISLLDGNTSAESAFNNTSALISTRVAERLAGSKT
jgi:glycerate kinase